jgi:hypothetical protein
MATKKQDILVPDSGLDRLREGFNNYLEAQLDRLAATAGDRLGDLTGRLGEIASTGLLPKVGLRVLGGESSFKALVGEKVKGAKESVLGKVKENFGAGGKPSKAEAKVTNVVEAIDIGVPLRMV